MALPSRWLAAALVLVSVPLAGQTLPVTERTLPNGMRFLFVERHTVPTVAAGWVAKVGAANERPGITGISHMLEHMMKKGTRIIGTKDAAQDARLMAEQDRVQAEIRREMSVLRERQRRGEIEDMNDPRFRTPRLQALLDEFGTLVAAQREILVKEELPKIYAQEGGAGRNAMTNTDMTAYVVTVPASKLELWCWLESDRMQNLVLREFYTERNVILEERRQMQEATPTGNIEEAYDAMRWTAHPYHWGVIGWKSDIGQVTREDAEEHFKTFYAPHNLTAVLVGDITPDTAWPMIERYFGRIPASTRAVPELVTQEPPHVAEQRMVAEADATPSVRVDYVTVPDVHQDSASLEVLAGLLSGRSGRLYKSLVVEKRLATGAAAMASGSKYAGAFTLLGNPTPERKAEEVETALYAEIDRLQKEPVTERELQKVKNQVEVGTYTQQESNFGLMLQLCAAEASGSYKDFMQAPDRLRAVTREDIQRVARKYFRKENRSVLVINRKGGAPVDPEAYQVKAVRDRIQKLEAK